MLTALKPVFESDDRRWEPRETIGCPSTVRADGMTPIEVVVQDLSAGGFSFRSADRLPVGAAVQVGLAGSGAAPATVVRVEGVEHGCAFVQPLSPSRLAAAFQNETVVYGVFGTDNARVVPQPVVEKWSRPARGLAWLIGGGIPWICLAAAHFA
ncbi:PilZ domain-containing protein [Sphingomonas sp.]|uniref:PilZ domain-containing protein n=1 Tax=Sphingomonas sp. TaxID=28214 RepID=UPI003CC591BF